MKRILILMLTICLLLGNGLAFAEYDTRVYMTGSGVAELSEGIDYSNDAIFLTLQEMFNFEYDLYPLGWDNWTEKNRMWISTGDLPTWTFWDFNYDEYISYIDQGLLGSLPDGWEDRFPHLKAMIDATGIAEAIQVEGKTYCVPKIIFYLFPPVEEPVSHATIYYRADWLETLGLEPFGDLITVAQLEEFTKKAIEADLAGGGKTIGLSSNNSYIVSIFMNLFNDGYSAFEMVDGKYVWGPMQDGVIEGIEALRAAYQSGVIDPDCYLYNTKEHLNVFNSGLAAAIINDGGIEHYTTIANDFRAANPDLDPYETVKLTALKADDGLWHGTASANYWSASIFNPNTDEETMNRFLAIVDYLCTREGQELISLGIPEVDWTHGENGKYVILREKDDHGQYPMMKNLYPSVGLWFTLAVLPDSFVFVNPALDQRAIDAVTSIYAAKSEGDYRRFDPNYTFFTSDAKAQYSVEIEPEIVRLMLETDSDIASEWAQFIEANRPIWEPVVNDLNEAYAN